MAWRRSDPRSGRFPEAQGVAVAFADQPSVLAARPVSRRLSRASRSSSSTRRTARSRHGARSQRCRSGKRRDRAGGAAKVALFIAALASVITLSASARAVPEMSGLDARSQVQLPGLPLTTCSAPRTARSNPLRSCSSVGAPLARRIAEQGDIGVIRQQQGKRLLLRWEGRAALCSEFQKRESAKRPGSRRRSSSPSDAPLLQA